MNVPKCRPGGGGEVCGGSYCLENQCWVYFKIT